jgi:hypothetical protein
MFITKRRLRKFISEEYKGLIEFKVYYSADDDLTKEYKRGVEVSCEDILTKLKKLCY